MRLGACRSVVWVLAARLPLSMRRICCERACAAGAHERLEVSLCVVQCTVPGRTGASCSPLLHATLFGGWRV